MGLRSSSMLRLSLVILLSCVLGTLQAYLSFYDVIYSSVYGVDTINRYDPELFWDSTQTSFRLFFANESSRGYKGYFSWVDITFHLLLVYIINFFLFCCFRKKLVQRYYFYIRTHISLVILKIVHYFVLSLVLLLILYSMLIAFFQQSFAAILYLLFLAIKVRNIMPYIILFLFSSFEIWFHVNLSIYNDLEASWSTYSTQELWTVTWSRSSFYLLSFFIAFFILGVYIFRDFLKFSVRKRR